MIHHLSSTPDNGPAFLVATISIGKNPVNLLAPVPLCPIRVSWLPKTEGARQKTFSCCDLKVPRPQLQVALLDTGLSERGFARAVTSLIRTVPGTQCRPTLSTKQTHGNTKQSLREQESGKGRVKGLHRKHKLGLERWFSG